MPPFITILLALAAGLLVGSWVNSAREAHAHFTNYRHRTATGLISWIRHTGLAILGVAGLLVALYVLLVLTPAR